MRDCILSDGYFYILSAVSTKYAAVACCIDRKKGMQKLSTNVRMHRYYVYTNKSAILWELLLALAVGEEAREDMLHYCELRSASEADKNTHTLGKGLAIL